MGNIVMQKGAADTNEAYIILFGNVCPFEQAKFDRADFEIRAPLES